MALFSFGDIKFKEEQRSAARSLYDATNQKPYNLYRYPIDLGDHGKGHYMIIYINEQLKTQYPGTPSGDLPSIYRYAYASDSDAADAAASWIPSKDSTQQFSTKYVRTIRRISDAVALYMPDTLLFSQTQNYAGLNLGGGMAAAAVAGGMSMVDSVKSGQIGNGDIAQNIAGTVQNLGPLAAAIAAQEMGAFTQALFTSVTGVTINPMMELLYTSPTPREFQFDFTFYPRSEKEADNVQRIIHRLRYHQAPEIDKESRGFFFIPPSEFDIKFYYNGRENENLQKISTCALTNINVDYAPGGFHAYEVPGDLDPKVGRTGMPVSIRLSLQFKELELITKGHLGQDIGNGGTMYGR
jgi:hypothetical protein